MNSGRRVLITGVASHWGAELARRLERDPAVAYVAGIDTRQPPDDLAAPSSSRPTSAAPRSRACCRRRASTPSCTAGSSGTRSPACRPGRCTRSTSSARSSSSPPASGRETLRTVIVRGSAAIYGCEGAVPSFFKEDMARAMPLRTRFQRDISELEEYFDNFARRHPELTCCMLRFQPEIGAGLGEPAGPVPDAPGRAGPARLRPAAAAAGRRGRDRGDRRRGRQPGARAGQRRARRGDLAEQGAAAAAPAGGPAAGPRLRGAHASLRGHARRRRAAGRRDPAAAVRPGC